MYRKQLREMQKDASKGISVNRIRKSERDEEIRKTLQSTILIHELEENQSTLVWSPSYEHFMNMSATTK